MVFTAFTMSWGCGRDAASRDFAYGIGMSAPFTLITGASSWKNTEPGTKNYTIILYILQRTQVKATSK